MGRYDGPTIDNMKLIAAKAKTKNDGVYVMRGIIYLVKDHYITHYFYYNEVFQNFGNFVTSLGFTTNGRKALLKIEQEGK